MQLVLETLLSNAVWASALAVAAALLTKFCRRPPVAHAAWLLVVLKLITPPLISLPIPVLRPDEPVREIVTAPVTSEVPDLALGQPIWLPDSPPSADDVPSEILSQEPSAFVVDDSPAVSTAPFILEPANDLGPVSVSSAWSVESTSVSVTESSTSAPMAVEVQPSALPFHTEAGNETSWLYLLAAVWATGSVVWLTTAVYRIRRFAKLVRRAEAVSPRVQRELVALRARFGIRRSVECRAVEARIPPLVWALGSRPVIVLPSDLLCTLGTSELRTVLAHELAHLKRRDHWLRRLEFAVLSIYWWHPVAWWACKELKRAEEECCDAWVVWLFPESLRTYAGSLLKTVDFLSVPRPAVPLGASSLGQGKLLKRRFEMILHGRTSRELSWLSRGGLVLAGLIMLPLSANLTAGAEEAETAQVEPVHPTESATVTEPVQVTPTAPAGSPGDTATAEPASVLAAPIGVTTAPAAASPAPPSPVNWAAAPATAAPVTAPSNISGAVPPSAAISYDPAGSISDVMKARGTARKAGPSIDHRLQKLEIVTEQIMQELRALRGGRTPPTHGYGVAPSQQPSVYNTLGHQPDVNNDTAVKARLPDKHAFEAQAKNLQLELQVLEQQLRLQELEIAKKRAELEWHEQNFKRSVKDIGAPVPTTFQEIPPTEALRK